MLQIVTLLERLHIANASADQHEKVIQKVKFATTPDRLKCFPALEAVDLWSYLEAIEPEVILSTRDGVIDSADFIADLVIRSRAARAAGVS